MKSSGLILSHLSDEEGKKIEANWQRLDEIEKFLEPFKREIRNLSRLIRETSTRDIQKYLEILKIVKEDLETISVNLPPRVGKIRLKYDIDHYAQLLQEELDFRNLPALKEPEVQRKQKPKFKKQLAVHFPDEVNLAQVRIFEKNNAQQELKADEKQKTESKPEPRRPKTASHSLRIALLTGKFKNAKDEKQQFIRQEAKAPGAVKAQLPRIVGIKA